MKALFQSERRHQMKNLKILFYKKPDDKPEKVITIPLSVLHIAAQLLPRRAKAALEGEGITLMQCKEVLIKEKDLTGMLIEIENQAERMVISVE
jgi:hypothetical protein